MSVVNFWTFDSGDIAEVSSPGGSYSIQNTIVRNAQGYALRVNPTTTGVGNVSLRKPTSDGTAAVWNITDHYIRFYFYPATLPSTEEEIYSVYTTTGTFMGSLRVDNGGQVLIYDKDNVNVDGSTDTVLTADAWNLVEWRMQRGASGNYELKMEGASVVSGTADFTASNIGRGELGKTVDRNSDTVDFYYDDVIVDDAAFLSGDSRGIILPVDADGTYTGDWTRGGTDSGANWSQCSDIPYINTTHMLSTAVIDESETFNVGSPAIDFDTIDAVKPMVVAKRNAQSSQCALRFRSNTTDSDAGTPIIGSAELPLAAIHTVDPATASAWLDAALDSLQVGMVDKDNADKTQMFAAFVFVYGAEAAGGPPPGRGGGNRGKIPVMAKRRGRRGGCCNPYNQPKDTSSMRRKCC